MEGFVKTLINNLFWALWILLMARVILSWVRPNPYSPLVQFVYQVTEPIMAPFRRLLPATGGIDFSPILVFIVLNFIWRFVMTLLTSWGW